MSAFISQKLALFVQKSTFTQSNSESCVRDCLVMFSVYARQKVTVTEKITFANSVSGIRLPDCSRLTRNPINNNDTTIFRHDVNVNFFWRFFVSLVKFSYWSKFYVNFITGSGIMTIFFYKGLARNTEIANISFWVLPNIWRLGRVMDTKFGTNVSDRMLLNAAKFQGYSFYCFWVIKGKPTGEWLCKIAPSHGRFWRNFVINF